MSNDNKMLKAMYRGDFKIGDIEIDCAFNEDETRILSINSVFDALGRTRRGLDIPRQKEFDNFFKSDILPEMCGLYL